MAHQRLLAIITSLLLVSAAPPAQARYNLEQLILIEHLVLAKDWAQLFTYLQQHPYILEGDGPLAATLNIFMSEMQSAAQTGYFAASQLPDLNTIINLVSTY